MRRWAGSAEDHGESAPPVNVRHALGALLVPALAVGYASYAWWEQADGAYREDTTQYMMVLIAPVLVLAGVVILQSLFEAFRAGRRGTAAGDGPPGAGGAGAADTDSPSKDDRGRYLRPALLTAGALVLVLTIDRLGYLPAFTLFVAGALLAMGVRSARRIALITAGVMVLVHVVFIEILDQPLPRGLLAGIFERGAGG